MELFRDIPKGKITADTPVEKVLETPYGKLYRSGERVWAREGSACREDFGPGSVVWWSFWHAEFHYILEGKAEVIYKKQPLYLEEGKMTIGPGSAYFILPGTIMEWKVDRSGPLKKLCVLMPYHRERPIDETLADWYRKVSDYDQET